MPAELPTAVILNPSAGRGRAARVWMEWQPSLRDHVGPMAVFETHSQRHAIELTRTALRDGYRRIISAGGDGTHFEVTNGYFENGAPIAPDASVAFLPLGSGADFTRSLHMPREQEAAVAALFKWKTKAIDVVQLELQGRSGVGETWYFQNIARAGAGGEVVARAERSSKRWGGFTTFLIATLQTVISYRNKPVLLEVDGESIEQRIMDIVVANGCYDGGGMRSAPHAQLDNGKADVYIYGRIGLFDALFNLHKIYTGRMMDRPDVVKYRQAVRVHATSTEHVQVEADGELLGTLPATFTVLPAQLQAVVGS